MGAPVAQSRAMDRVGVPGHRPADGRRPWPRWIDGELAVVAVGIGLGSLALGGRHEFTAWRSALLGAAIVPWAMEARLSLPRLLFAPWVIGWETAYLFAGGEPFSLMLF